MLRVYKQKYLKVVFDILMVKLLHMFFLSYFSKISVPWFEAYVAQTVKGIEEAFRYKAKRTILTGIKGDIKKGKFT